MIRHQDFHIPLSEQTLNITFYVRCILIFAFLILIGSIFYTSFINNPKKIHEMIDISTLPEGEWQWYMNLYSYDEATQGLVVSESGQKFLRAKINNPSTYSGFILLATTSVPTWSSLVMEWRAEGTFAPIQIDLVEYAKDKVEEEYFATFPPLPSQQWSTLKIPLENFKFNDNYPESIVRNRELDSQRINALGITVNPNSNATIDIRRLYFQWNSPFLYITLLIIGFAVIGGWLFYRTEDLWFDLFTPSHTSNSKILVRFNYLILVLVLFTQLITDNAQLLNIPQISLFFAFLFLLLLEDHVSNLFAHHRLWNFRYVPLLFFAIVFYLARTPGIVYLYAIILFSPAFQIRSIYFLPLLFIVALLSSTIFIPGLGWMTYSVLGLAALSVLILKVLIHHYANYRRALTSLLQVQQIATDFIISIPSNLFIFRIEPKNRLLLAYANSEAEQNAGLSPSDLHQKEILDIYPFNQIQSIKPELLNLLHTKQSLEKEFSLIVNQSYTQYGRFFAFPIADDYLSITYEDITRQKLLEQHYTHVQKLEATGQLASGVAHNLNNLLTIIIGNLTLAEFKMNKGVEKYLQNARQASDRASNLVRQLLVFSHKSELKHEKVDLNQIVEKVSHLLRERYDPQIHIENNLFPEIPLIQGEPAQLQSMLMNVCNNAKDALFQQIERANASNSMTNKYTILIETDLHSIQLDDYILPNTQKRGLYVILRVIDNGVGMSKEVQKHMFEPFYSTKEVGEGEGLGLFSVFGIVQRHHGWIDVNSEEGKGTTFNIFFPVMKE